MALIQKTLPRKAPIDRFAANGDLILSEGDVRCVGDGDRHATHLA